MLYFSYLAKNDQIQALGFSKMESCLSKINSNPDIDYH